MGDTLPPNSRCFTEHVVFLLLLLPTFVVLVAAVVSLAAPDPTVASAAQAQTTAACGPACGAPQDEEGSEP